MTDPKAPLPDDVEKAIDFLASQAVGPASTEDIQLQNEVYGRETLIRSHISAQAEKISELESENKWLREALQTALSSLRRSY